MLQNIKNRLFGPLGGRIWTKYQLAKFAALLTPINKNKYFCISMGGNSYGCNIRALSEYIVSHHSQARCIWTFNSKFKAENQLNFGVESFSFLYYYHLFTSKYLLCNHRMSKKSYPYKRKGQIYLQTWHGTALKKIEKDAPGLSDSYIEEAKYDSSLIDIFTSESSFMSNIYRNAFWYDGKIIETGTPRNDIFFYYHPEIKEKVHLWLHTNEDTKIVLYAPTFRTDYNIDSYNIDIDKVISTLEKRTKKTWKGVIRLHPNLLTSENICKIKKRFSSCIDASVYPDMQELLYTADILITDFSATMFDFMNTGRPCFLYVPDWDSYDRGFYWEKEELPFTVIENNTDIETKIVTYDSEEYNKRLKKFREKLGSTETGHAAENIFNYLMQFYNKQS